MTQHLQEIHQFMRLVESPVVEEDDGLLLDSASADISPDRAAVLMEDLGDMIFKLQSYRETGGSEDYALGVEEGLQLAAGMLVRLIESHSG